MNNNINEIWVEVLNIIKEDLNEVSFSTWFKPIKPLSLVNNTAYLLAPEDFLRDMLTKRYINLLKNAFSYILNNEEIEVKILIPGEELEEEKKPARSRKNQHIVENG